MTKHKINYPKKYRAQRKKFYRNWIIKHRGDEDYAEKLLLLKNERIEDMDLIVKAEKEVG
jgi:hypothetical protein